MTDHVQVRGTAGQEQHVSMSSEAENRVRRQWAVRKAGRKPRDLNLFHGTFMLLDILDPNHPSASILPKPWCFHFYWFLGTCT